MCRATDPAKDQSYVLAGLDPAALDRMSFPVGELHKGDVRARAREHGLAVANKPDSQDLCFLAGTGQARFLARHGRMSARPGPIRDRAGRRLGEHGGVHGFTVGQRRGLGIGGGEPLYVLGTDHEANTVTVGPRGELLAPSVDVRDVTLHRSAETVDSVEIRYRGRSLAARVHERDLEAGRHPGIQVDFEGPVERTAPGQLACLYAGEVIVGHGTVA